MVTITALNNNRTRPRPAGVEVNWRTPVCDCSFCNCGGIAGGASEKECAVLGCCKQDKCTETSKHKKTRKGEGKEGRVSQLELGSKSNAKNVDCFYWAAIHGEEQVR